MKASQKAFDLFAARPIEPALARTWILRLSFILFAGIGCFWIYSRGLGILPTFISTFYGAVGMWIALSGVFLALIAKPPYRGCLVVCWLSLWFTAGLAAIRSSAITDGIVLGGIIPYSDASNYLQEASRIIEGRNMTLWGSRRPLADAYISGLLYISGGRVTLAVMLAGLFTAASIGLAATELRARMGILGALLWTWILLIFSRRYVGEMMSEQAGIALGALSVALLVRGYSRNAVASLWIGLLLLSLALNARVGPLFVLPMLLVAVAWHWRGARLTQVLIPASLCVFAAFVLDFTFVKWLGPINGKIVSNYHNVLYGIVFGGNWQKAAVDIPNYSHMDDSAQATEVYRRILIGIRASPSLMWRGAARSWSDFFAGSTRGLGPYSFFRRPQFEEILIYLSAIGMFWAIPLWHRLSPVVLAVGVGTILSVPFLPPGDADLMRAYAAAIPLMLLVPSFGLLGWREWLRKFAPQSFSSWHVGIVSIVENESESPPLNRYCFPYLIVLIALPLFARFLMPLKPTVHFVAMGSDRQLAVDLDRCSWIELKTASFRGGRPEQISSDLFENHIFGSFRYFYPNQAKFLDSIARPGIVLVCPGSAGLSFLVIDSKHLGANKAQIRISGYTSVADLSYNPSFIESSINSP